MPDLSASTDALAGALGTDVRALRADLAALGRAVDRTGAPYTVLAEDIGRRVLVDDVVTLPVLTADEALGCVDIVSAAGADLTPVLDNGVAPLVGASLIEPTAAASLILRASDGTSATWHLIGGRA